MNTKSFSTFDLNWVLIPANWACALFALGEFESFMIAINWVLLVITVSVTIISVLVRHYYIKKNNLAVTRHYPRRLGSYLILIVNIIAMNVAGWYWLAMGYTLVGIINMLLRWWSSQRVDIA